MQLQTNRIRGTIRTSGAPKATSCHDNDPLRTPHSCRPNTLVFGVQLRTFWELPYRSEPDDHRCTSRAKSVGRRGAIKATWKALAEHHPTRRTSIQMDSEASGAMATGQAEMVRMSLECSVWTRRTRAAGDLELFPQAQSRE